MLIEENLLLTETTSHTMAINLMGDAIGRKMVIVGYFMKNLLFKF